MSNPLKKNMSNENDRLTREQALDWQQSFIVHAPAGSGKTELLTQRFLSLLANACQHPEEIIAITFTRKAAREMKERIFAALELANNIMPPEEPHRINTWGLAKNVLVVNKKHQWELLENPQRLRILTIDAFLAQLSQRVPLTAGTTPSCRFVEDARTYYLQAIQEILKLTASNPGLPALKDLLLHLDNQIPKLIELCVSMLGKRDQWLPYIIPSNHNPILLRQQMEKGLLHCVEEALQAADIAIDAKMKNIIFSSLHAAALNLKIENPTHPLSVWADLHEWPQPLAEFYENWRALADLFLTQEGEWRKKIDTRQGFPPKTPEKKMFESLLAACQNNNSLQKYLQTIQSCPPLHYKESQWRIIAALMELLPLLAAQLQLIFQQKNIMDFVELGLAASRALGEEEQPSDLSLTLDYQIQHILIDEFQDTSVMQFNLLKKLITGWQPGDHRSLFLVGDPMQSIYRFRNAEVGLFFRVKQQALSANVNIKPLSLHFNFRSANKLVTWFNEVFPAVMPTEIDLATGAVPYSFSISAKKSPEETMTEPQFYPTLNNQTEAKQVIQLIKKYQQANSDHTIAILVRSRTHLKEIIIALHKENINFQAIDIDPLASRSEILDLVALVRALTHGADRIAWLALLHSPCCGLKLKDLHVIAENANNRHIYEVLADYKKLALSAEGQLRLARIFPVFHQAFLNQGRMRLTEWIENTWVNLGGPAGLTETEEIENVQTFFNLLLKIEENIETFNLTMLNNELMKLYAPLHHEGNAKLQIMTIHKAKGLEFDHVILPGLQRKTAVDDQPLLLWLERAGAYFNDLILAPIKETTSFDADPIYNYLRIVEKNKLEHESSRLLYVAVTRAKNSLDLLAVIPNDEKYQSDSNSFRGSFLEKLWPFYKNTAEIIDENFPAIPVETKTIKCVPASYKSPYFIDLPITPIWDKRVTVNFKSNALQAKIEGIAIHEALAYISHLGQIPLDEKLQDLYQYLNNKYGTKNLPNLQLAIQNTLQDPRGLWILFGPHQEAKSEYALKANLDNKIVHVIMDRTFIDTGIDPAGVRWIIDYKTTSPETDYPEHQEQLTRYAQIMALTEKRVIRLGLYYPLSGVWKELDKS